jgi:phosphatidylglycerophosphatase A
MRTVNALRSVNSASITLDKPAAAPSLRFAYSHPAHALALMAGVGVIRYAPGTFGTLIAFPLHVWLLSPLGPYPHLAAIAGAFLVGIWACERTGRDLGASDHGGMVIDETVAFLLVLFFTPDHPLWHASAFLLFRLFDILKPPPIRYFDRTIVSGFGVMFDDLLAAGYALLCLAAAKAFLS